MTAPSRAERVRITTYTIPSSRLIIRVEDDVLLRPAIDGDLPYIAKIKKIYADPQMTNVKVKIKWYYRPEDTARGRRIFHGLKELFYSDHTAEIHPECIDGICKVWDIRGYQRLRLVKNEDYFSRFKYSRDEETYGPDEVEVFCYCATPLNPDLRMILCELCRDWYHLICLDMSLEESQRIPHFYCHFCSEELGGGSGS